MAPNFVSSGDGKTDIGNQAKHHCTQEDFVSNTAKIEDAHVRSTQYDLTGTFMVLTIHDKNASDHLHMEW